jgi:hemin uptake protein HemP
LIFLDKNSSKLHLPKNDSKQEVRAMKDAVMAQKTGETGAGGASQMQSAADRNVALTGNRLESRDLFIGTKEITIGHEGDVYRLRLTALNKLILTK